LHPSHCRFTQWEEQQGQKKRGIAKRFQKQVFLLKNDAINIVMLIQYH